MAMDPEALYLQLGQHLAEVPNFDVHPVPVETHRWLATAYALVKAGGDTFDAATMKVQTPQALSPSGLFSDPAVMEIMSILYRTLAVAEVNAPSPVRGSFIPAGNVFDALAAFGKVLTKATKDVLLVDPYMDEKALTDFAVLVPETVQLRLLADQKDHKPSLKPAAQRWTTQHGSTRPLEVRLAPKGVLHDRLIFIHGADTWSLTQSLNAFAARSPASILKVETEVATLKRGFYENTWQAASPL